MSRATIIGLLIAALACVAGIAVAKDPERNAARASVTGLITKKRGGRLRKN